MPGPFPEPPPNQGKGPGNEVDTFLQKLFFPEGMGVYKILMEILEGWGVILLVKNVNSGEGGLT